MIRMLLLFLLLQRGGPPSGPGVVTGILTYSDGTPAVSLGVLLTPLPDPNTAPPPQRVVRADPSGAFRLVNLPAGRYTLRVDYPGISPIYYPGVVGDAAASVLTVSTTPIEGLQFRLPPAASGVRVSGRVVFPPNYVRPQNPPVVQVRDLAFAAGMPGIPITTDGKFEIPHVRPGEYSLLVSPAPGMLPVRVAVADRDIESIELMVPRLIDISGTVTADDRTRPGFTFSLVNPNLPATPAAVANGTFSAQLPAGEYRITAQGLPAGYYFKAINAGTANLLRTPLRVEGTDPVRIAVTLGKSAGVQVRGRVQDAASPAASRRIALVDPIQLSSIEGTVAADGVFDFERVMPGSYLARLMLTRSIGTAPVSVTIPDRNVSDLEISSPGLVEIRGRVAVDGSGSLPRFTLLLVRGGESLLVPGPTASSLPTVTPAVANIRTGVADTQILSLAVNALPDGTFKIHVPEGKYRVAIPPNQAIPPAFFLRDIRYGPARLLDEPLVVSAAESHQLFVGFGTTAPNPWVKVSGRVVGADPAKGPYKVALTGNTLSATETFVEPDGKFEFPRVLQGAIYTAQLIPETAVAPSPRVEVRDKDVAGVEIVVPPEREVTVRASVAGTGVVPTFAMALRGTNSSTNILVKPETDGTFRTKFPADERRIQVNGLPLGYSIRTMTYAGTDLRTLPFKVSTSEVADIVVVFALDPALPMGSVRGRIKGLDPDSGSVRIALNGAASYASFETSVDAEGGFSFPKIPQGSYVPSLKGGVTSARLTPAIVTVTGTDLFGVEIEAPKKAGSRVEPLTDDTSTGARLSDLAGGARETVNENAATGNLRTLNTALVVYLSSSGGNYGSLADLVKAGLIDRRFVEGPVSGFHYTVIASGSDYAAVAIPVGEDTGRNGLFSVPDAVVRYSTFEDLAPPRQAGNAVQ